MGVTAAGEPGVRVEPWRWGVVWLLFAATMINYMDRGALANTSEYILPEFEPDKGKHETLYGDLNFAFGLSFALFQIVAGFVADRFSLRWSYLLAVAVWSAAGFLTGLVPAGAVAALFACRILLGVGEAFNWPCAVATVRRVVPRESRGLANGVFHSGASLGAVLTPFVVLALVNYLELDWRSVFLVVGALGLVWVAAWWAWTRGPRALVIDDQMSGVEADSAADGRPWWAGFGMRTFWITLAVGCSVNVCWHFYNTWFVRYLKKELALDSATVQWGLVAFFVAADLGSMFSGWLTRQFVRGGASVERSRQWVMGVMAAVCLLSIPASLLAGTAASFVLYLLVAAGSMGGFAIFFSLAQDILPRHTAKLLGICGATAWVCISLVNQAAGKRVDQLQMVSPLFIVIGCVPLIGAAAIWLWPRPAARGVVA